MLINEIFRSISGEARDAGFPAIFIRTFGCPLRCSYCDSYYALEGSDYKEMNVIQILQELSQWTTKRVVFTGGEPLIQKDALDLIDNLLLNDYHIEIETCGAVPIDEVVDRKGVTVTMDWKCPSSGMEDRMLLRNLDLLKNTDTLKFVVGSREDLDTMKLLSQKTKAQCFASPVFGKIEPKEIVEYMLDNNLDNVKFQLQIHKYVWPADQRGV